MKKLDTTKPIVHADWGTPAKFIQTLSGQNPGELWICLSPKGIEEITIVDEFGCACGHQVIKNVPETITFWVPVWRSEGGLVYIGFPKETQDKPTLFCDRDDLIKWAGPFTTTTEEP